MHRSRLATVLTLSALLAMVAPPIAAATAASTQEEESGRGDDLARIKAWREFLTRADRAFFAARHNTAQVREKIAEADDRIEELEAAAKSKQADRGGRSDITGDVAFLERAHRAFTAAKMNTADVQKWLNEAREKS